MKTGTKIITGLAVFALALASVGTVSADTMDTASTGGYGRGADEDSDGQLAAYMEMAIAEGLGLTVEELNALDADGSLHAAIAADLGFTAEEFDAIMDNAQTRAVELAAADGITIQAFGRTSDEDFSGGFGMRNADEDFSGGFGMRNADEGYSGGFSGRKAGENASGGRMNNAEACDEETCQVDPLGTGNGARRGGRR